MVKGTGTCCVTRFRTVFPFQRAYRCMYAYVYKMCVKLADVGFDVHGAAEETLLRRERGELLNLNGKSNFSSFYHRIKKYNVLSRCNE